MCQGARFLSSSKIEGTSNIAPALLQISTGCVGGTTANDREFHEVMRLFFAGRLRPIVDDVVPLADGAAAQRRLAEGTQFGKLVLRGG
jgi:NADPH:quinone reductase-like Zn-dependent oxidoreductase